MIFDHLVVAYFLGHPVYFLNSKRQRHRTYIATQAANCSCSDAVCHRHRRRIHTRPQPKPALTDFGLQSYSYT